MKKLIVRLTGWLKRRLELFLLNENQKQIRKQILELERNQREALRIAQENCKHIAGGNPLSNQFDICGRTSIVWHTLNTGTEVGICLNCQKQFWPSSPDYLHWKAKRTFCKPSKAGILDFSMPRRRQDDVEYLLSEVLVEVSFSGPKEYNEKWGW